MKELKLSISENDGLNSPTEGVQEPKIEDQKVWDHLSIVPAKYQNMFLKSVKGELSPREAIKVNCLQCVGYRDKNNMIGGCLNRICPLWQLRPFQKKDN